MELLHNKNQHLMLPVMSLYSAMTEHQQLSAYNNVVDYELIM